MNFLKLNGCVVILLLLAACSGDDQDSDGASKKPPAELQQAVVIDAQPIDSIATSTSTSTSTSTNAESKNGSALHKNDRLDANQSPPLLNKDQVKNNIEGVSLEVLDISERSYDGGNAIAVTLSVPLDPAENHEDYLSVSLVHGGNVDGGWVISKSGKIAYFPHSEPSTSYNVQVYKGLKSINGKKLQRTQTKSLSTREIRPSYSFVSKGSFLPLDVHTGLPVAVVNTPEVNVDFFKIKEERITAFLSQTGRFKDSVNRYYTRRSLTDGELVYSARYQFEATKNKRREFNLPVHNIEPLSNVGVYVAVMTLPGEYYDSIRMTYFMVTDLGMHVRVYENQIDAYISSLKSAEALKGVEVSLVDSQGLILKTTKTTPEGLASFNRTPNNHYYLIAKSQQSISIVPFDGPALDLSDFKLGDRPYRPQELFIYGPRDLYRPGEVVDFSALLRNQDGGYTKNMVLKAKVKRPDGQTAKEFRWNAGALGYYGYAYALPADAKTGEWQLEVHNIGSGPIVYKFKVEEFLPERMKLTFNSNIEKRFYTPSEKLSVNVQGEYLYGAPASGNRFESRIQVKPLREPIETLKGFQFGDIKSANLKQDYQLTDIKLNENGLADVVIDNRWSDVNAPVSVTLLGSLFETGGRPVTRRHVTTIWPKDSMVGIRPSFKDKNPKANSRVQFDIVKANAKGDMLAAKDLEVKLIREDRRYFWEYSAHQGWHYEWSDQEYTELTTRASAVKGAVETIELAVEYGAYRLEVKDIQHNTMSSIRFYAGRDWYYWWKHNESSSQAARPDKVSLAFDKESYKAGETAILSIVPPAVGEAIVMVESDEPLFMQRVHVPAEGLKLEIPIAKNWNRHDLYASVVHLQKTDGKERISAKRSLGLLHLPLNRAAKKIRVSFDVDDKIVPNQRYEAVVKVDGIKGSKAQLTLAAVDVGVLSITDFKTPDPHQFFFEPRRYQVDSRDMYQKLIELNKNPVAEQRFGGDAALSRGGKNAQAEVQIVSLYSGPVNIDKNGIAKVSLDIPDFNGRVRLMAVAFTEDSMGSAEQEMTIAAPLVTQLAMPRFLAMGDQSTLALDIHNLSDGTQSLSVNLAVTYPVVAENTVRDITLKQNEKVTLLYPVSVAYQLGRSQIDLNIRGMKEYPLSRSWGIQVRAAHPALIQNKRAILKTGESLALGAKDYAGLIPESIEAVLSVNNNVDLKIREQMDHLLRYPYGCLEQSTSSTYPWLFATADNLKKMGIKNKTHKNRQESIYHGLQRIKAKMLKSGAYGLWSNNENEQHWLTAYVGDFLTDAKAQGVKIDEAQYNGTMKRLKDYLRKRNGTYANRWSAYPDHYDFAYRAYAGYVLSRHNKAHLSSLRDLANHGVSKSESFLPLIHLGLALINQGDQSRGNTLLNDALKKDRGDHYYADYGSTIRDMALSIHLLLRHQQKMDEAKAMGIDLADLLKQRRYLSTQERNAIFLAGLALETHFSHDWQANLTLKGAVETLKNTGALARKFESDTLQGGLSLTNQSKGDLFVEVDYQGYSKQAPKPESSKNLQIERTYFDTKGNRLDPSQLNVGDLVLVGLRVNTRWRAPDVLVVDLLPAGLELENQNLNHAIKLDEIEFDGKPVSYWRDNTRVVHQEYRDDRYVAAVDVGYGSSSVLFYLARAVTPGVYGVPAPLVEDMYRAEDRAVGETINSIEIVNP